MHLLLFLPRTIQLITSSHARDHANFDPDQKEALKNLFAEGNDEAVNVTYGSTLFTDVLLQNVPSSSKFVMGLNLKTLNVSIALETARAAWNAFSSQGQQSRLHMTVGNEPDQWGWGAEDYEPHVAEFLQTIQSELDLPKNWFQVGDLANAPDPQIVGQNWTNTFLLRRLLELGVGDAGDVWTMSQHTYPFSVCTGMLIAIWHLIRDFQLIETKRGNRSHGYPPQPTQLHAPCSPHVYVHSRYQRCKCCGA